MILIALLTLAVTASPPKLAPGQVRALARAAVCPERLADDAARIRSVETFFSLYGTFRPASHAGERIAYRDAILRVKRCKAGADLLIHTFPES
jgi:hypothetical protein